MVERMKIGLIIRKYDNDLPKFFDNATKSEIEAVLNYAALRAIKKQRKIIRQADLISSKA